LDEAEHELLRIIQTEVNFRECQSHIILDATTFNDYKQFTPNNLGRFQVFSALGRFCISSIFNCFIITILSAKSTVKKKIDVAPIAVHYRVTGLWILG
jgi:hypothetical protein